MGPMAIAGIVLAYLIAGFAVAAAIQAAIVYWMPLPRDIPGGWRLFFIGLAWPLILSLVVVAVSPWIMVAACDRAFDAMGKLLGWDGTDSREDEDDGK